MSNVDKKMRAQARIAFVAFNKDEGFKNIIGEIVGDSTDAELSYETVLKEMEDIIDAKVNELCEEYWPKQDHFTFGKVLLNGNDQTIKLKTIDDANLILTFGLETVTDRSFNLVLKEEVFEIDGGKAELSWRAEDNKQYHVECGNHIVEKYSEKQRVTCYNQKNGGKRTIQTPILDLHNPVEFEVSEDVTTNIALVKTGQLYGLKAEVKRHGEIVDTEMIKGDIKWNSFNSEQSLKLEYSVGLDQYSWICAAYRAGDELPDKDLSLSCRIPKLEFNPTNVNIANGNVYGYLKEYGININMWVSKEYRANGVNYELNFWNRFKRTETHSLLEKDNILILQDNKVKYKANVPYYGWIRIIRENPKSLNPVFNK